jgi:WD40 repeat protein
VFRWAKRVGGAKAWLAIVGALAGVVAAVAALGDKIGAPNGARIALAGVALVLAVLVAVLSVREGTKEHRALQQRRRSWLDRLMRKAAGRQLAEEMGDYFSGRVRVLREIVAWLEDPAPKSALLVVCGHPGSGKSAVVGRVVAAADPSRRSEIAATAAAETLPRPNAVDLFIDCAEQTATGVALTVAGWGGLSSDSSDRVIDELVASRRKPLVLVVDSLDEAGTHGEGIARWLRDLADRGRPVGIRVLVATRPGGPQRALLRALGATEDETIDLDTESYFLLDDMVAAVEGRLLRDPDSPAGYRSNPDFTREVAAAVAHRAQPSFLIAWAGARELVRRQDVTSTADAAWVDALPTTTYEVMEAEFRLDRFSRPEERDGVVEVLTALAYARGGWLPIGLWPIIAGAIAEMAQGQWIEQLWRTSAADLVDRMVDEDGTSLYRLFHAELGTYLRLQTQDSDRAIERRIVRAILDSIPLAGAGRNWRTTSPYVRTHLAGHAGAAGVLDDLLLDRGFALAADPPQLLAALATAISPATRADRLAYREVARFLSGKSLEERAAYLEMAYHQIGAADRAGQTAAYVADQEPWRTRWAHWTAFMSELTIDNGSVPTAIAQATVESRDVLVSAGSDGVLQAWDIATGDPAGPRIGADGRAALALAVTDHGQRQLAICGGSDGKVAAWDLVSGARWWDPVVAHNGSVWSVAVGEQRGRRVVISGGHDGKVLFWDLSTGDAVGQAHTSHSRPLWTVAVGEYHGEYVGISGDSDGTLCAWKLDTGATIWERANAHDGVAAVVLGEHEGRDVAISGGRWDGTLRIWDLASGTPIVGPIAAHEDGLIALALGDVGGLQAIISAGANDGLLRLWELPTGSAIGRPIRAHQWTQKGAIAALAHGCRDGRSVVVSGGADRMLRVWDFGTVDTLEAQNPVRFEAGSLLACGERNGRPVVISGKQGTELHTWDIETGEVIGQPLAKQREGLWVVALAKRTGRPVVISGDWDDDGILEFWDLDTGALLWPAVSAHGGGVLALALSEVENRAVLISGGWDGTLRLWDLSTGQPVGQPLPTGQQTVRSLAVGVLADTRIVVSGGSDGTLRAWDLGAMRPCNEPRSAHDGPVWALAVAQLRDTPLVFSGGQDGCVRAWDLATGEQVGESLANYGTSVAGVAVIERSGRTLVVSGGGWSGTLRVRDLDTGEALALNVGSTIQSLRSHEGAVVVGAHNGLMVIDLNRQ